MRARRRLPVIAGMALSAVVIAAPTASASDIQPRQDCSKTNVEAEEYYGGLLGLDAILARVGKVLYPAAKGGGGNNDNDEIRAKNRGDHVLGDRVDIDIDDSFNCSNFVNDSFNRFHDDDHGDYGDYSRRHHHRHHGGFDHGRRDHGRDHGRGHGRY